MLFMLIAKKKLNVYKDVFESVITIDFKNVFCLELH